MSLYKRGGMWYVDYYWQGKRYQRRASESKREAEKMHAALQTDIERGIFQLPPRRKEKQGTIRLVDDLAVKFCNEYVDVNISHPKNYRCRVRQLLKFFGGKTLAEVNAFMIEGYKKLRKEQDREPASINRELACLKKMFNVAIHWDIMNQNPMRGVSLLRENNKMMMVLGEEVEAGLLDSCGYMWHAKSKQFLSDPRGKHLKPILIVALDTGMRCSEILRLKWEQIDWQRNHITLVKTKNNEVRVLPMTPRVRQTLEQWKEANGASEYVFRNDKTGKPFGSVKNAFHSACKRAGVVGFRFHDARHTFATRLLDRGVDIKTVQELLGHSNISVTSRYVHSSMEAKKRAIAALSSDKQVTNTQKAVSEPKEARIISFVKTAI